MTIQIRVMHASDAEYVFTLNKQLGYDYPVEYVHNRILSLSDAGNDILLIVEIDGKVAGYAHGSPYETLYSNKLINMVAFVVDDHHDKEIEAAEMLYQELEHKSKQFGYAGIRLVADKDRKKLEQFFVEHGYESRRALKHYIKIFR